MSETIEQPTAEQIAQNYKAALDSVHLIQAGKPDAMEDSEWQDTLKRNKDHLILMLAKTYWTNEDLTPLEDASK
jgi:hypothetical protein